jgi:hypothetical protein
MSNEAEAGPLNFDVTSPNPGSFASDRQTLFDPENMNIEKIWKELQKVAPQEKRERATTAQEGNTRILTLANTLSEYFCPKNFIEIGCSKILTIIKKKM